MDDLELLREFRRAMPPADEDRFDRAHARLLAEITAHPRRRSSPLRKPTVLALIATPTTAAIIAVLAFAGTLGGNVTSLAAAAIIHRADQALSPPPNEIVHTKVVGNGVGAESWQLTSRPYSFLAIKGPLGHPGEQAANGATSSFYDPSSNTIYQSAVNPPQTTGDPVSAVQADLHNGRAQLLGSAITNGVPTYEIRFAGKDGFGPDSLIAYFDKQTYRPVLLSDPQRDGTIVQLRVVTFEYLPATPQNLRLLSPAARHPGAKVVIEPGSKATTNGK